MSTRNKATQGGILKSMFNPFYNNGRRLLGFSPEVIDAYLSHSGYATMTGRMVTLGSQSLNSHQVGTAKFLKRRKVGAWVNEFNARARIARNA